MSGKKDETWVLASAMEHWARAVRQMQERISELAGQLEQMERITVRREPAQLAAGPKEDPEQPAPLTAKKIAAAAAYWAQSHAMPPWLPICSQADAAKIVEAGRARAAEARAKADPKMAERAAAVALEEQEAAGTEEASAGTGAENQRWPAPPEATPEQKKRKLRAGLKRISYRMLAAEISAEHGHEVVSYAMAHICQGGSTAKKLRAAMERFLGVFPTKAEAGKAFLKAHNDYREGFSERQCEEDLGKARHKIRREDGQWAVWSHHVAPGDVGPS